WSGLGAIEITIDVDSARAVGFADSDKVMEGAIVDRALRMEVEAECAVAERTPTDRARRVVAEAGEPAAHAQDKLAVETGGSAFPFPPVGHIGRGRRPGEYARLRIDLGSQGSAVQAIPHRGRAIGRTLKDEGPGGVSVWLCVWVGIDRVLA